MKKRADELPHGRFLSGGISGNDALRSRRSSFFPLTLSFFYFFDCGSSFIVIVGNEVGTVHTSVWRSLSQSLFLFLFFLFVSLSIHAGPIFASSRTGSFITSRRIVNIYIPVVASSPFDDTYKENSYSKGDFRFPNKKKTIERRKKNDWIKDEIVSCFIIYFVDMANKLGKLEKKGRISLKSKVIWSLEWRKRQKMFKQMLYVCNDVRSSRRHTVSLILRRWNKSSKSWRKGRPKRRSILAMFSLFAFAAKWLLDLMFDHRLSSSWLFLPFLSFVSSICSYPFFLYLYSSLLAYFIDPT